MKKRRIISGFLSVVMLFSLLIPGGAKAVSVFDFTDVKSNDWYYGAVDFAVSNGLFTGKSTTQFGPNDPTTRGMLVTVLGRRAGVEPSNYPGTVFSDVSASEYYAPYINWAFESDIVNGTGEGAFSPNASITRQDLVTIFYRFIENPQYGSEKALSDIYKYTDYHEISEYAKEPMCWAFTNGVIQGVSSAELSPRTTATRAQVAQIFMNSDELLESSEPAPAEVRAGVYTCYTDAFDFTYAADYRPSVTINSDNTFSLVMNYGEGMGEGSGTWSSYVDDAGDTIVLLAVTTPSNWSDSKSYTFSLSPNGNLLKEDGPLGITPVYSVFTYDGELTLDNEIVDGTASAFAEGAEKIFTTDTVTESQRTAFYEYAKELENDGKIANLTRDGDYLNYEFTNGWLGSYEMARIDEDMVGGGSAAPLTIDNPFLADIVMLDDSAAQLNDLAGTDEYNIVGSKKVLFLSAFPDDGSSIYATYYSNLHSTYKSKFEERGFEVEFKPDATVAHFRDLNEYGVIFIFAHGKRLDDKSNLMLEWLYDDLDALQNTTDYKKGWVKLIQPLGTKVYKLCLTPGFFKHYYTDSGKLFPNSYIHLTSCTGLQGGSLAYEFIRAGAGTVTGYDNIVKISEDRVRLKALLDNLLSEDKVGLSIDEACEKMFKNESTSREFVTEGKNGEKHPNKFLRAGRGEEADLRLYAKKAEAPSDIISLGQKESQHDKMWGLFQAFLEGNGAAIEAGYDLTTRRKATEDSFNETHFRGGEMDAAWRNEMNGIEGIAPADVYTTEARGAIRYVVFSTGFRYDFVQKEPDPESWLGAKFESYPQKDYFMYVIFQNDMSPGKRGFSSPITCVRATVINGGEMIYFSVGRSGWTGATQSLHNQGIPIPEEWFGS